MKFIKKRRYTLENKNLQSIEIQRAKGNIYREFYRVTDNFVDELFNNSACTIRIGYISFTKKKCKLIPVTLKLEKEKISLQFINTTVAHQSTKQFCRIIDTHRCGLFHPLKPRIMLIQTSSSRRNRMIHFA